MNYSEAREQLGQMLPINLMDFNDYRLNSAVELVVGQSFEDNIFVDLGEDLLEVSQIIRDEASNPYTQDEASRMLVIRNLRADSPEAMVMLDNARVEAGRVVLPKLGEIALAGRKLLTVGTAPDATPQLRLAETASPHHMHLRLGNMAGNVHFADLYSQTGTTVYLSSRDHNLISSPTRGYVDRIGGSTIEAENQHWSRG